MKQLPSTQRSLPIALIRARENVMTPIRQMLSESGLTEQQWRVLRVLDEYGALEPSQLAKHAALLLPSQTRIVQSMAQKGLVERREHRNDRRRTVITAQIRDKLGPRRFETLLDILDDLRDLE
ncbi:MAG: MarR family transcriptional regulator [Rhodobacteraceae bacterium]|nr:MarR family transcriptional regulator [Paracoccaceae bacterium]